MLAVVVDPDGRDLGTTVGHERCEIGEGALLEKIEVLLRDRTSHEFLLNKWEIRPGRIIDGRMALLQGP
jgi:hypothetical protein